MRSIIDSHVHLSSLSDVAAAIERSRAAGVDAIISMGGELDSSKKSIRLSYEYPDYVYPCIGVHPSEALNVDPPDMFAFIGLNAEKVYAIGEIGLDYSYSFAKPKEVRERQRLIYEGLLSIAGIHGLPVSVHSRSAYRDALTILRKYESVQAVFHWYDGPLDVLRELLDYGYYVSATPAVEYSKGHRAALLRAPLERILVETDSPVFLRNLGRQSEPADVLITVKGLAELKEQSFEEVMRVSTLNTETLFRLDRKIQTQLE
jgi:TatD DNase family protein